MTGSAGVAAAADNASPRGVQLAADTAPGTAAPAPNRPEGARETAPPARAGDPTTVPGLDGKDVVDVEGDRVGRVEGAVGDALIVAVGGFLGLGERKVAVPVDRLALSRTGDDVKVVTNMTKDQLKALPDYREGAGSRAPDTTPGRN